MTGMPTRCAADGSFHVKSDTTYFMTVLVTVRVLPFFLTVTLIRSGTLTVSTLEVRSYSDQRYASMQMSATQSSGGAIARTGDIGPLSTGSEADADASRMRVSGGRFGSEVGTDASCMPVSGA